MELQIENLVEPPAKSLERATGESDSLVDERFSSPERHLSNIGPEKSGVNLGRPLSKAKYSQLTDSEYSTARER